METAQVGAQKCGQQRVKMKRIVRWATTRLTSVASGGDRGPARRASFNEPVTEDELSSINTTSVRASARARASHDASHGYRVCQRTDVASALTLSHPHAGMFHTHKHAHTTYTRTHTHKGNSVSMIVFLETHLTLQFVNRNTQMFGCLTLSQPTNSIAAFPSFQQSTITICWWYHSIMWST